MELSARRRFRLTEEQTNMLSKVFEKTPRPDRSLRTKLTKLIPGASERSIQVWFQNKRSKLTVPKKKNEVLFHIQDFSGLQTQKKEIGVDSQIHFLLPTPSVSPTSLTEVNKKCSGLLISHVVPIVTPSSMMPSINTFHDQPMSVVTTQPNSINHPYHHSNNIGSTKIKFVTEKPGLPKAKRTRRKFSSKIISVTTCHRDLHTEPTGRKQFSSISSSTSSTSSTSSSSSPCSSSSSPPCSSSSSCSFSSPLIETLNHPTKSQPSKLNISFLVE